MIGVLRSWEWWVLIAYAVVPLAVMLWRMQAHNLNASNRQARLYLERQRKQWESKTSQRWN